MPELEYNVTGRLRPADDFFGSFTVRVKAKTLRSAVESVESTLPGATVETVVLYTNIRND